MSTKGDKEKLEERWKKESHKEDNEGKKGGHRRKE